MSTQLSQREKVMVTAVGVVVLIVLNLLVIQFFMKNQRRLKAELSTKAALLEQGKARIAKQDVWKERAEWLKKAQPKLENEGKAGVDLLAEIREVGNRTNVPPLEPQIGTVERRPYYTAVSVTIETKASKEAMRDFLYEMQSPERSIVFETANLQFDKTDKTQMHGKFRIAKWFAK